MNRRLRLAARIAALALLVLGIWWMLHGRGPAALDPSATAPAAQPQVSSQTEAAAEPNLASADAPARIEEPAALAPAAKESRGSLLVHVLWGDDQSAAAGIVLALHRNGADELFEQPTLTSDAEGNARFADLAPGRVYAQSERGETAFSKPATIEAGKEARVELTLEFGLNATGLVVDARERPVADAEVLVTGWAGGPAQPLAHTGEDGRFALRCLPTHCHIGARKPGFAASPLRQFTAGKGASVELTIMLGEPAAELAGIVLDPAHQPVAGAIVQAGREDRSMQKLPDGGIASGPMPARTQTDAQGRFAFRSLGPGTTPVCVRARGLAPWEGSVELERGREGQLTVQLVPGVKLSGTVRDSAGEKVPKATLYLGEWGTLSHRGAISDAQGEYVLEGLSTGELKLHAERDGKGAADVTLQASAGQSLRWDPVLSNGLVLAGRVLDAEDKPVSNAMIEGQLEQPRAEDRWFGFANTDKEGRFRIENCEPGRTIGLALRRKSMFPELKLRGVVPGGEELVVHMPKEAWVYIQGRVLGPDDKPLPSVHISPSMSGAGGCPAETANPETGEFRYGPYPPGEYQLTLQADGYARMVLGRRVLAPDEVWDVGTLHLEKGGSLLVYLTRADGQPADDAWLQLLDRAGNHVDRIELKDGSGSCGPLAAGSYLLQIGGAGLAARQQQVEVQTGVELRVDVQAQTGLPAEIVCSFPDGVASSGEVQVSVKDAAGLVVMNGLAWSQDGAPKMSLALLEGTYSVEAKQGALHGSGVLTVVQGAEVPSRVVLALGP